ncbi:MAG: ABC transporter permease [Acidimicrobiales bacterium]
MEHAQTRAALMRSTFGVAWYRFRATLVQRRSGYLAIVLVVGLLGGLAMASVAGARRTQSSFSTFLASTHPSDLSFLSANYRANAAPTNAYARGYNPGLIRAVTRLPGVTRVESYAQVNATGVNKKGGAASVGTVLVEGSVDGEFFNQDRVTVVKGRMSRPTRANEIVVSAEFARAVLNTVKLPVTFTAGLYTNAQVASPQYGTPAVRPQLRLLAKVVGIVKYNDTIVQDDVDASPFGRFLLTPALTRLALHCCVALTVTYVTLRSARDLVSVEAGIVRLLPRGIAPLFYVTSDFATKANQSIEPVAIALGVFGGIAALVTLVVALLVIGRELDRATDERAILRAVGAAPSTIVAESLFGPLGAVIAGTVLAVGAAYLLSPLAPLGPVRPYYPRAGLSLDATVFAVGAAVLVVVLGGATVLRARRRAPHRLARRSRRRTPSFLVGRLRASNALPAPALTGLHFALDAGSGAGDVPARSAISGVIIAASVIVGTLTFGASLDSLVSHPQLYGWNWDYEISSNGFGYADIPQAAVNHLLAGDRYVASWSGVYFDALGLDGITEPVIGARPGAPIGPPILSGHGLDASNQVVLGAATLAALHKRVGQTVTVDVRSSPPVRLTIVGTATLPTVGQAGTLHTTMGTGAMLDYRLIPAASRNPFNSTVAGPQAVWVRLRPGAPRAAALRSLQRIAGATSLSLDGAPSVLTVQRPAQIVNYRSMGTTPALLALGLAAGSILALGLTLVDSVRRRRRNLAVLKALGFTRRQLAATVAWQSSVSIVIGEVIGVPLGVVAGRFLWTLFTRVIHVVPATSVPVSSVALVALGGLALGNVVALFPGRIAARTPTALLLKSE